MSASGSTWKDLLHRAAGAFSAPSFTLFCELSSAWVCATGRRTICGMAAVMDPATGGAHDAYHRLVRAGVWSLEALWTAMVAVVIEHWGPRDRSSAISTTPCSTGLVARSTGRPASETRCAPPATASSTPGASTW